MRRPAATATWHMRYRVIDDNYRVVRDLRAAYHWHVASVPLLQRELSDAGFSVDAGPLDVLRAVRNP